MLGKGSSLSDGLKGMSEIIANCLNLDYNIQDKRNDHKDFYKTMSAKRTHLKNYSRIGVIFLKYLSR